MKRNLIVCLAALACFACNGLQKESPLVEEAAHGYLVAIANYRFDEAEPYSSKQTVENTLVVFNRMMKFTDTAYVAKNTPAEITITGVKVLTKKTALAYYHKHSPITELDDTVSVIKENGRWVVDDYVQEPPLLNFLEGHQTLANPDELKNSAAQYK